MSLPQSQTGTDLFPIERVRRDFPTLHQEVHGRPLVYLDSAASALKPQAVVDTIARCYLRDYSNVHRGVHDLSRRATEQYEAARETVRAFLGAEASEEIVFTRGTTESINLVASSWGGANLKEGDEILLTGLEHHSNIVPWQLLRQRTGARIVVAEIGDDGDVPLEALTSKMGPRTKMVAIAHVSNALGTVLPVAEVTKAAHEVGAVVLVDGAQAAPHLPVNVQELGADFYALSGHKLYGPTGIGVLYGRRDLLEAMPPYQGGGDMIRQVTFEKTTFADPPAKFEAGTPHIAGAIGLGAAIDYLESLGRPAIRRWEEELLAYGTERLEAEPGIRLVGTAPRKAGVLSFLVEGVHPHDVGTIVDLEGVAIRTGHHCAQPVMDRFGIPATSRASLGLYNTREDIDRLIEALRKVKETFA